MCIGTEPCDMCLERSGQCALDFAPYGPWTLEQVGEHMGLTRERVRQIEDGAMLKMARQILSWNPDMVPDGTKREQVERVRARIKALLTRHPC